MRYIVGVRARRQNEVRLSVRFDPVGRYLALSGLEVQLAGTNELVEFPLERIFHIRVPR